MWSSCPGTCSSACPHESSMRCGASTESYMTPPRSRRARSNGNDNRQTMASDLRFREVEHTADRAFTVRGRDLAELFERAAYALCAIQGQAPATGESVRREIELSGIDRETLLVNWLNELLYLQEVHKESYSRFQVKTISDTSLRASARLYADEALLEAALEDNSVEQLVNTATLPGITKYAIAMPDIHQGYGFPIGGVVATRLPEGVISPGGVGYDINCGVRLLVSSATVGEVKPYLEELASALYANCPSGVGIHGSLKLQDSELDRVLVEGARWALKKGYASREDIDHTEEFGRI